MGGSKKILEHLILYSDGKVPTFFVGNRRRLLFYPQCWQGQNNVKLKSPSESSQGLGSNSMSPGDAQPRESWGATTTRVSHAGQGYLELFQLKQSITRRRVGKGKERSPGFPQTYFLLLTYWERQKGFPFLKLSIFQKMLWIERVRGGPLCGVPVQCSQVGQDHGSLGKAEETQARLDPHNIHVQMGGSPLALAHLGWQHPELPRPHQPTTFWAQSLALLFFALGQLTVMDWNCLLGIYQGSVTFLVQNGSLQGLVSVELGREHICINEHIWNIYA